MARVRDVKATKKETNVNARNEKQSITNKDFIKWISRVRNTEKKRANKPKDTSTV